MRQMNGRNFLLTMALTYVRTGSTLLIVFWREAEEPSQSGGVG